MHLYSNYNVYNCIRTFPIITYADLYIRKNDKEYSDVNTNVMIGKRLETRETLDRALDPSKRNQCLEDTLARWESVIALKKSIKYDMICCVM